VAFISSDISLIQTKDEESFSVVLQTSKWL